MATIKKPIKKKDSFWDDPKIQAEVKKYQDMVDKQEAKLSGKTVIDYQNTMMRAELLKRKKILLEKLRVIPYEDIDRKWWYFSDRQFFKFLKYVTYIYIIYWLYEYLKQTFF